MVKPRKPTPVTSQGHTAAFLVESGSVLVTLTTPAARGLTEQDFQLAARLELAA